MGSVLEYLYHLLYLCKCMGRSLKVSIENMGVVIANAKGTQNNASCNTLYQENKHYHSTLHYI